MTKKYTYVCRFTALADNEEDAREDMCENLSSGIKSDEIYDWFELETVEGTVDINEDDYDE